MSAPSRLPDFLIIGAAKSGTTTVWEYLNRHSGIFMTSLKEPEYFSSPEVHSRGLDWYRALFGEAREDQLCGEASTTYSRWPHTLDAPKLISELSLDPKFIYIMRHPVERAFSHYAHHMRLEVTMSFEEALERDAIYLDCSLYMDQIERYLRFFPRESFLFLEFSELRTAPELVLARVQEHLGVEGHDLTQGGRVVANPGGADHYIRERTTQRLRKIAGVSRIADAIPDAVRQSAYSLVKRTLMGRRLEREGSVPRMKPDTRARLLRHFEDPNRELERFLGRDLASWYE